MDPLVRRFAPCSATIGLLLVVFVLPMVASTYTVNNTADLPDTDPVDGVCKTINNTCTLRAAIMQANFTGGANTIILPAGTYTLTRVGYDDDAIVGDLDIKHDLTIQGAGSSATIVDGNGSVTHDRVFQILSTVQNATLRGMTIRNGSSLASTVGVIGGGGLYIEGTGQVQLSDVIFDSNTGQNGGGIYANFSSLGGSLELDHVVVHANTVIAGGVGAGGGVYAHIPSSSSQVIVRDSKVYGNVADGTGGGIYVDGNSTAQWSIQRSEIYSNTAASGGAIGNFVPLNMSDSHVHDNHANFDGGAMEAFAPYTISRTALDTNSAGRFGGGIFTLPTSGGTQEFEFAHVEQSTLSGNSAKYGGGIYHDGFITPTALINLINTTVSGNSAGKDGGGGDLYLYSGHMQLLNSTVLSNRVLLGFPIAGTGIGGGLYIFGDPTESGDTFIAQNSLIANNARGNGITLDTPDDGYTTHDSTNHTAGTVTGNLGFNLIKTTTNFFISGPQGGNIVGQDPLLGPLQNNGGSTQTHALLPGSPAIDTASAIGAPAQDQRGYTRIGAPDIGAFEFGGTIPVYLGNVSTRAFVGTGQNAVIVGFIIKGGGSKSVLLRTLGPTLGQSPFNVPNALANPILELHDSGGNLIISNDNWGNASNKQAIMNTGKAPPNALESAILISLTPGSYTAIARGVNNGTGNALVEAYNLDDNTTPQFLPISLLGALSRPATTS
jgi:hypothetical protein